MTEQIGKCPYCGSDQVEPMETWGKHYVTCACGATGPNAIGGKDDAVALWNAVANQLATKDAEIEQLREALADANHIIVHHGTRMMRAHTERIRNINLTLERNAFMERKDE